MQKVLLVIDMQHDFVSGSLGTAEAQAILPAVAAKIAQYRAEGQPVLFTRDTHTPEYLSTQEGKRLPVEHCIAGTAGHALVPQIQVENSLVLDKPSFGSLELADYLASTYPNAAEFELCGLCTDICVVSNALILKAKFPETTVSVDAACCAGVTPASHEAALITMKMCQVDVKNA